MPSTQTRTKLKAFQFIEGTPALEDRKRREEEKENLPIERRTKETPRASKVVDTIEPRASQTPKLVQSKTCPLPPPSTPATRLPLADLVGNVEDARRNAPKPIVSPEEQLCWHGSQPVNTPLPRKRKRARSSSPVGASQEEPKIDQTVKNLDTPQADPATELWTRYTHSKGTPTANKGTAFAHLINESSPRSSASAGNVSGLRRWTSCGVEFPASTRKRRRIGSTLAADQGDKADVFNAPSSDGMFQAQPQKSKMAGMLQRMRESIFHQQPKLSSSELPSSSSPLPDTGDRHPEPVDSPLQQRYAREQRADTMDTMGGGMEAVEEEHSLEEAPRKSSGSSDEFGDDDFDTEMVEALDISQRVPEQSEDHISMSIKPFIPVPEIPRLNLETSAAPAADTGSDDEFAVDDEDLFAADLEKVASLYDCRPVIESEEVSDLPAEPVPNTPTRNVRTSVINLVEDDDSDEFGDDLDADDLEAAEVAATQGANTVCRSQTTTNLPFHLRHE